jgi:hypothetical protein
MRRPRPMSASWCAAMRRLDGREKFAAQLRSERLGQPATEMLCLEAGVMADAVDLAEHHVRAIDQALQRLRGLAPSAIVT